LEFVAAELVRLAGAEIASFIKAAEASLDSPGAVLALVEQAARDAAGRIGQTMIEAVCSASTGYVGPVVDCGCGRPAVFKGVRGKKVATLSGPVKVDRAWYHCRTCRCGFAPLDGELGLIGKTSHGLVKACALTGMEMPFSKAAGLVEAIAGTGLVSTSSLARSCRRSGDAAKARADAENNAADMGVLLQLPLPGVSINVGYMLIDGTGAPMVPAETTGREGKGEDGRSHTREVKIGCFFTQAAPTPKDDPVREKGSNSYIATFEDAASFARQLRTEHIRRGFYKAKQLIIIGDGAKWIWNIADRDWPQAVQIVDYYHACEHVHRIVDQLTFMLARPKELADTLIGHLNRNDIAAMTATISELHLKPKLATKIDKALDYFKVNAHRMRYDYFKAKGWFIGSGQVESACKTIVAQRAKQSGMRWTIQGLDPIITMRALHQSHRDHLIWETKLYKTTQPQAA